MEQMMAMMRQMQGGGGAPAADKELPDTAEKMFKSIRVNKKPEESLFPRK